MSINNKPIVILVYLQHAGWFFFPPVLKMELLESSEMLPKNKPQRQTAGWGLPGTGAGR